jgi:hypothetical protein
MMELEQLSALVVEAEKSLEVIEHCLALLHESVKSLINVAHYTQYRIESTYEEDVF